MQKKSEAPEAPEVRKENGIGKSIGRLVRAVVFLALALFLIICSNNVLRQVKYRLQKGAFPSFYAQEKNSIDIVTIGSSADYRYIDTPMLYELFGYTSYNLATAQQPTSVTRFIMNEAEKSQSPSLFVVEAREFVHLPESKQETVDKYGALGLILLVAIPLPGTGAWTGSLVAALMKMRLQKAVPCIFLGVIIAAVLMTVITKLGIFAFF